MCEPAENLAGYATEPNAIALFGLVGLDPGEHAANLGAGLLDLVAVDGLALLEEPLVAVLAVSDELACEVAVLDAMQDLLHGLARLLVDDLRAGVVLAVLGGVGDGVVHEVDAGLVHEVDDHLHLMVALEVSQLGRVTGLGQGLETGLDQFHQTAAQDGLLACLLYTSRWRRCG